MRLHKLHFKRLKLDLLTLCDQILKYTAGYIMNTNVTERKKTSSQSVKYLRSCIVIKLDIYC